MIILKSFTINSNLNKLIIADFISSIGDGIFTIASLWWIKETTGSDTLVAVTLLAKALVTVIFGLFGGSIADTMDKVKVMLSADLFRALVMLAVFLLLSINSLTPLFLIFSITLISIAGSFFSPSFKASVPLVVREIELSRANGKLESAVALATILGPALGGMIVATVGVKFGFVINSISFLFSAIVIMGIRLDKSLLPRNREALHKSMSAGISFIKSKKDIMGVIAISSLLNLISAPITVILPGYSKDTLGTNAIGFGFLSSAMPIGFLIGAALLSFLKINRYGIAIIFGFTAIGLLICLLGVFKNVYFAFSVILTIGLFRALVNISISSFYQIKVPKEMLGRLFGVTRSISTGLQPIGMAVTPVLIVAFPGVPSLLLACGAAYCFVSISGLLVKGLVHIRAE